MKKGTILEDMKAGTSSAATVMAATASEFTAEAKQEMTNN